MSVDAAPAPNPTELRLTHPNQIRQAFRNLRWRLATNNLRTLLTTGARLRVFMVLVCSAIFWAGLFWFFFQGFRFVQQFSTLSGEVIEIIFSMFFLSLLIMLVFSTGIILFTSLFQSREAAYLLTTPAPPDRIFAYKFFESLAYSSWAFLLLGSPMMVALGIVEDAGWRFYAIFPVFFGAFVLIPGSLGAIASLLVAVLMPRNKRSILIVGGLVALVGVVILGMRVWRLQGDPFTADWLDGLFGRLEFSRHPLWPSRWMSAGLVAAVRGDWATTRFYLIVLVAHAGFGFLVAAAIARDLYRVGYGRVQGGRSSRRHRGWYGLDALFHRLFFFLPTPIRLLILKDLRTFRRDPAQWSQFLIFFGLLAFYFINIRRLSYDVQKPYWRNLISFLNLSVTALILSTFTSRFIFPLLSLEGRNFWVLGLLPLRRASILWGKFAFSTGISLVATEILVILSDLMLRMGPAMISLHIGMVAILCLGLSGISVGLGARLPNLKEDDPSKIAAGFGGTLNLLISLAFIVAIVTAIAVPCHLYYAGADAPEMVAVVLSKAQFQFWMTVAILVSLLVGLVATVVPLRVGIKAFQSMEL